MLTYPFRTLGKTVAAKLPHGPDGRGMCDGPTAAAEATSFPILLVIRPSQLCSGIPDSEDRNAC